MSENLGTGVSYVNDPEGYNYDTVVFQKGKPPLDSELNLSQDVMRILSQRQLTTLSSGFLTMRPFYTSSILSNSFYTQDPATAIPEYALVNGYVLHITNTKTSITNANLIELGDPPSSGSRISGVYLEVWRALLDPDTTTNRPDPETLIDAILDIDAVDSNKAWAVGENGMVLATTNAGETWNVQTIDTKRNINGVYFVNSNIGWLVGNDGVIARTSTGGLRWSLLESGYTENFNGIFAISQSVAWAVGNSGLILKTTNGINWTPLSSNTSSDLQSVYFYDSLVGWVVGKNGVILKTVNGGSTWTAYSSGTTNTLNSVYFYDLNFGFAVGNSGTILRSSDGGLTWVSQTGNIWTGSAYTSYTVDYTDVSMVPNLDEHVIDEEVSSQFTGSNKNCTLMHAPVTLGNGLGTITNTPSDITVTVNNVEVTVDVLIGASGQIILTDAPKNCDTVKVSYWYKISTDIFRGSAWITGKNHTSSVLGKDTGTVLHSSDIGEKWVEQDPGTAYDINAVGFADLSNGWVGGAFSIIRHSINGGTLWSEQKSNQITRQIQRAYNEGNVDTSIYLNDDCLNPDVAVETTKRVQVQYKIRIADADPFSYPDILGASDIVGLGPNSTGTFAFENQGSTTGDYGLWRAKCAGTVDGYCWAIPIAFVARRNTRGYSSTYTNGQTLADLSAIRPDLLTAANVVDSDILDIRRKSIIPSMDELLNDSFEKLLSNSLKTKLVRETLGEDHYGTEILQTDTINVATSTNLPVTFAEAVVGGITSIVQAAVKTGSVTDPSAIPDPVTLTATGTSTIGLFHHNSLYYSAVYNSSSSWNRKPIPGIWSGNGTNQITFTFSPDANTSAEDPGLNSYDFSAVWYIINTTKSLKYIPSKPCLVKNTDPSDPAFYHQGVFLNETSRRIEEWDSGISGYLNYALVYPGNETRITATETMASTVELHYFVKATTTATTLTVALTDLKYSVFTVSQVINKTAGYSYKIKDITLDATNLTITSVTGFTFIKDSVFEIVALVKAEKGNTKIRNGASVNFDAGNKKISTFCASNILYLSAVDPHSTILINTSDPDPSSFQINGIILGVSSVERIPLTGDGSGTLLPVCWVDDGLGYKMHPIAITLWQNSGISFTILDASSLSSSVDIKIQVLIKQSNLVYSDDNTDGLLINYYYIPFQSTSDLPASTTVKAITRPENLYVSNVGYGGTLVTAEPYTYPLVNIPVNETGITDTNFYNVEPLRFSTFSIDSGFALISVHIPGNISGELTFTGIDTDIEKRTFYDTCSKEFKFIAEGLLTPAPRKIFVPLICQVTASDNRLLLKGEYVLIIVSRNSYMDTENYTGYVEDDKSVIALYRLQNRPIGRI